MWEWVLQECMARNGRSVMISASEVGSIGNHITTRHFSLGEKPSKWQKKERKIKKVTPSMIRIWGSKKAWHKNLKRVYGTWEERDKIVQKEWPQIARCIDGSVYRETPPNVKSKAQVPLGTYMKYKKRQSAKSMVLG